MDSPTWYVSYSALFTIVLLIGSNSTKLNPRDPFNPG